MGGDELEPAVHGDRPGALGQDLEAVGGPAARPLAVSQRLALPKSSSGPIDVQDLGVLDREHGDDARLGRSGDGAAGGGFVMGGLSGRGMAAMTLIPLFCQLGAEGERARRGRRTGKSDHANHLGAVPNSC